MLLTVERIEDAGPDRRARRLFFAGESEPRLTSSAVVRALGLEVGTRLETADLEAQLAETEKTCLRERALRVISYRERSASEVTKRLLGDGYPPPLVHELVAHYVELGLIDDQRFAGIWIRSRTAAGFGRGRIERELAERGLDAATIAVAFEDGGTDESEIDRARDVLRGKVPSSRAERDKLIARLLRRGYSLDTAKRAVGECGNQPNDT